MTEARFEELSYSRCVELLSAFSVGRIAVVVDRFPIIFPVNYRVVNAPDPWLAIRTRRHSPIDRGEGHVAFEIDSIDTKHQQGWSVLVRGGIRDLAQQTQAVKAEIDSQPWTGDERDVWLAVQPLTITGRALHHSTVDWEFDLAAYL